MSEDTQRGQIRAESRVRIGETKNQQRHINRKKWALEDMTQGGGHFGDLGPGVTSEHWVQTDLGKKNNFRALLQGGSRSSHMAKLPGFD